MRLYLKLSFIIFFIFFSGHTSRAQRNYSALTAVPVREGNLPLSMPWGGGLNAPILQNADITGDGQEELLSFDRTSQSFMVFSRLDNSWQARPDLSCLLPPDISNWFLMKDYDGDGQKDIFTFTPGGIRVFKNVAAPGNEAVWELMNPLLQYQSNERQVNLLVNSSDVPAIEDVDGDGDLDVLTYDPSGGGGLEYYRNQSVEVNGQPGLEPFVKESSRWGGLAECACGVFAYNDEACKAKGSGLRLMHAGGKALLLFDVDKDGDFDLLNGFEECTELYYLENKGSNTAPLFDSYQTMLPGSDKEVNMKFPAAFALDVEEDDMQEVAVSTQLSRNTALEQDFSQSVWLFRQQEQEGAVPPAYELVTKSFLQENMIDAGESSIPAFLDIDADGDLDMLLGSAGKQGQESAFAGLKLFLNTGTPEAPSFELESEDFLGIGNLSLIQLHPQTIDFNGDGKMDLLLVATETVSYQRKVFLWLNKAAAGKPADFSESKELATPIHIQLNPFFYDVNKDGAPDLLVGKFDGSLSLYENTGTVADPQFGPEIKSYLGFGLDNVRRPLVPSVGDLNGDGQPDLLLSDGTGKIRYIESFLEVSGAAVTQDFELCRGTEEQNSWLGRKSWPVVVPLRKGKAPMVAVGNLTGGLWLLETDEPVVSPPEEALLLQVFPNPVNLPEEEVFVLTNMPATVRLLSVRGQLLEELQVPGNIKTALPVAGLAPALYVVQAHFSGAKRSAKLIILK